MSARVQHSSFSAVRPLRVHTRPESPYVTASITVYRGRNQITGEHGWRWEVSWKAADDGAVATFYGSGASGSVGTEAEAWAAASKAVAELPVRIEASLTE